MKETATSNEDPHHVALRKKFKNIEIKKKGIKIMVEHSTVVDTKTITLQRIKQNTILLALNALLLGADLVFIYYGGSLVLGIIAIIFTATGVCMVMYLIFKYIKYLGPYIKPDGRQYIYSTKFIHDIAEAYLATGNNVGIDGHVFISDALISLHNALPGLQAVKEAEDILNEEADDDAAHV